MPLRLPKPFFSGALVLALCVLALAGHAQQPVLEKLLVNTDTSTFSWPKQKISIQGQERLYLAPATPTPLAEVSLYFSQPQRILQARFVPGPDYTVADSLRFINGSYFRGRLQFNNLKVATFPRLVVNLLLQDSSQLTQEVLLHPYFAPVLPADTLTATLYQREERVATWPVANPQALRWPTGWQIAQPGLSYKVMPQANGLEVRLKGTRTGTFNFSIPLSSRRPYLDANGLPATQLPPITVKTQVNPTALQVLNSDRTTYFLEPMGLNPQTLRLDKHPNLGLGNTYRLEDRPEAGGRLIAEVFVSREIANTNQLLGQLRTYALHSKQNGPLYLKYGNRTLGLINFNIVPKPNLEKVALLRPGQDWNSQLNVLPGETIDLRFTGPGLGQSGFAFGDGKYPAVADTTRRANNARYYSLTVPENIDERRISISMNGQTTPFELLVKEYQRPHPLNFVTINWGKRTHKITINRFNRPELVQDPIQSIVIGFDREELDQPGKLYGVQYIDITVRIRDPQGKLIEIQELKRLKVLPAVGSMRYANYNTENPVPDRLDLNDRLGLNTKDLPPWSTIEVEIKHHGSNLGRKIKLIRSQHRKVDIDVSFPAGLLANRFNEEGIGSLTGISTAALIQWQWYKEGEINRPSPFRLGFGVLALDALNSLSDNQDNKDLGLLVMASFYPLKNNSKVNFPLHAGLGYLFQAGTGFFVVGPGIQVSF